MAKTDQEQIAKRVIVQGLTAAGLKPLRGEKAWVIDIDRANIGGPACYAITIVNGDRKASEGLAYALCHTGNDRACTVLPWKSWMRPGRVYVDGNPVPRLAKLAHVRENDEVEMQTADIDGFKQRFTIGAGQRSIPLPAFEDKQTEGLAVDARAALAWIMSAKQTVPLTGISVKTHHDNDMTVIQLDGFEPWQRAALAKTLAQVRFNIVPLEDVPANQIYLQGDPAAAEKLARLCVSQERVYKPGSKPMQRLRGYYADFATGGHAVDLIDPEIPEKGYNFHSYVDNLLKESALHAKNTGKS